MSEPTGQLQRMRHVKNYRHAKLAHDRKRAHVDHQIVITKTRATFRHHELLTTNFTSFIDDVARVLRREKLAFLHVDGLPRFGGGDDQICLPRQKCRYLKHVDNVSNALDLRNVVNVGEHRHIDLFLDALQDFETGVHAETAEALD